MIVARLVRIEFLATLRQLKPQSFGKVSRRVTGFDQAICQKKAPGLTFLIEPWDAGLSEVDRGEAGIASRFKSYP